MNLPGIVSLTFSDISRHLRYTKFLHFRGTTKRQAYANSLRIHLILHELCEVHPASRGNLALSITAADILAKRFEKELEAGRLSRTSSAKVRVRALVDLMKGLQLRAKAGIEREELLQDARSYVPLILGEQI